MKLSYIVEFRRRSEYQMYEAIKLGFRQGKPADQVARELRISDLFVKQCYKVLERDPRFRRVGQAERVA